MKKKMKCPKCGEKAGFVSMIPICCPSCKPKNFSKEAELFQLDEIITIYQLGLMCRKDTISVEVAIVKHPITPPTVPGPDHLKTDYTIPGLLNNESRTLKLEMQECVTFFILFK